MRRTLMLFALVALAAGPLATAPLTVGEDAAQECRGVVACDHEGRGPIMPLPCAAASVTCAALVDHPYSLAASDANAMVTPPLVLSLRTQRSPPSHSTP